MSEATVGRTTTTRLSQPHRPAVALRGRSALILTVGSAAGLLMLVWPLLGAGEAGEGVSPPYVFLALLPVIVLVIVAELTEGGMDSRVLAMLGVLSACNAIMRPLGAGIAGIETVFLLLILGGRVFGAGFGFVLGCSSLLASALLTGGIGPWLPFQMLISAWIGLGAGLLPRRVLGRAITGRAELALLVVYGIVAAYAFGALMNLSTWPFALGVSVPGHEGELGFVPGAPPLENLRRFAAYTLITSTSGWDTGRAITTTLMLLILGPAILTTLRRAARRATVTGRVVASADHS